MPAHTLRAPKRQTPTETRDPDLLPVGRHTKVGRRFIYVHYENGWNFHRELGWLPKLSKLIAVPGVNGVGDDGSLTRAINGATAKGGTVIRPEDRRLLQDGEDPEEAEFYQYGRYYDTTTGQRWWVAPGQEPTISASGRDVRWNTDESAKVLDRFRRHLIDAGIIEPIHPLVIAEKVDHQRRKVDDLERRAALNPHLAAKLKTAAELLDAMQAAPVDEVKTSKKTGRKVGRARRGSVDG